MKKTIIIIAVILLIIIVVCVMGIKSNSKRISILKQSNKQYEQYLNKNIYGTDVISILNKAINDNEHNAIQKDENESYIENEENSIIIEVVFYTNEEELETTTYRMETIQKVGISEFISNFNTEQFKISKIEYHKRTEKVKYIEITQQLV